MLVLVLVLLMPAQLELVAVALVAKQRNVHFAGGHPVRLGPGANHDLTSTKMMQGKEVQSVGEGKPPRKKPPIPKL
jgi:hypothetical protein